jgi:hypothetical protein
MARGQRGESVVSLCGRTFTPASVVALIIGNAPATVESAQHKRRRVGCAALYLEGYLGNFAAAEPNVPP